MSKTLFYFLLSGALLFFAAGLYLFQSTYTFINSSMTLNAEVVEIKTMRGESVGKGRPGLVQRPLVKFVRPSGDSKEFIPKVGSHDSSYHVGQQLEILYDESTDKAVLKSFSTTWLFPVILCGLGLLIIAIMRLLIKIMPKQASSP